MSNINEKITNCTNSYMGGAKQSLGEKIDNPELAAAGAAQKNQADAAATVTTSKTQNDGYGHQVLGQTQQKNSTSAATPAAAAAAAATAVRHILSNVLPATATASAASATSAGVPKTTAETAPGFLLSPYEQEYQQQQYVLYHQQLREQQRQHHHQRLDSVSSVSSVGSTNTVSSIGIAPLGWSLPGMAPPQITDQDLRYYQSQPQHKRTDSTTGSLLGDDLSSGVPSPSPSHISLISDHSESPLMAPVAPLAPKKHQAVHPEQGTPTRTLTPDPADYKVEVK
ncbi:hypothetical protein BGZ65_008706 [Modicella reniformis]|uniref:Uncharacterized protein n=1 Tax=Modicella reniformis TaxID=1440133 RepID=A0A9P6IJ71_9FUNG|nr:hypothetical protein BGZ65_008706 [Modicella reniformis]